jgi:hypothetical protein
MLVVALLVVLDFVSDSVQSVVVNGHLLGNILFAAVLVRSRRSVIYRG